VAVHPPVSVPSSAQDAARSRRLGTGLIAAATAYLGAAMLMGLVFASSPPSQLDGNLADFQQGLTLYRWGFVGASLLAPALVTVLVLLLTVAEVPVDSARRWVGSLLLAAYVPFATIVYTSQYTFLPGLVERDPVAAALWYMHDAASIPYSLDLVGYALLGVAAIVLATALTGRTVRFTWIARALIGMGALSLAALGFHAAGATTATSVATLTSALFTLPLMVLAIAEGRRRRA
jgi:hypothetical protein